MRRVRSRQLKRACRGLRGASTVVGSDRHTVGTYKDANGRRRFWVGRMLAALHPQRKAYVPGPVMYGSRGVRRRVARKLREMGHRARGRLTDRDIREIAEEVA